MSAPVRSSWRRGALLAVILLGTLLGPLDSAVNIAFPDITTSFAIELKAIRWVVIAYVATYASLMLVFGRIGDLFGHARVFSWGLMVCSVGFAICSMATDYNWLLVARVLQGIGTAMVLSCGPALATNLFGEHLRPRILGTYAMTFGLGGAIGPSLGGLLVDLWGWPAVFWFRLPLAIVALLLVWALRMPAPSRDVGQFDLTGSIFLAAASGLFLLTFSQLELAATHPLRLALLGTVTLLAIVCFITLSQRASTPILDLNSFSNFSFAWINAANIIVNLAGFATMLFVPYFLVRISGLPLWQSGLVMAVGPLGMMLAANLAGRSTVKIGANRLALAGAILVALGLWWISFWDGATGHLVLPSALLLHGAGLGLFQVASLEIVTTTLSKTNRGVAGSLTLVMRTIGVVMAASILTIVFTQVQQNSAEAAGNGAFVLAFQTVFQYAAIGLAAFIAISMLRSSMWMRPNR